MLRSPLPGLPTQDGQRFEAPEFVTLLIGCRRRERDGLWAARGIAGQLVTFSFAEFAGQPSSRELESQSGVIAVALGAFAEPGFGEPRFSVYGISRRPWSKFRPESKRIDTPGLL